MSKRLPEQFSRVITLTTAKGGNLKTTLATNIGGLLANAEQRVLLIDLDPQGDAGDDLGYLGKPEIDDNGKALSDALIHGTPIQPVTDVREGLDVLIGGEWLHQASAHLGANPEAAETALQRILDPIVDDYELVFIDLPPGDHALRVTALATSRWAFVPTKSDKSSIRGIREVARTVNHANMSYNEDLEIIGIVLVDTGHTSNLIKRVAKRTIMEVLEVEDIPELFTSTVRHLEKTAQGVRERGVLFHELGKLSQEKPKFWEIIKGTAQADDTLSDSAERGALDIEAVTRELIQRIVDRESEQE